MVEKIGIIKNPLTIIAIFAGIAEVSGTIVLPFVAPDNQFMFILFLIFFPAILVIIFFLTLNFNHKVLYAPSDYKDESNFMKFSRYDSSIQEKVSVSLKTEEAFEVLMKKYEIIEYKMDEIIDTQKRPINISSQVEAVKYSEDEFHYEVSNFPRVDEFISLMKELGYNIVVDEYSKNVEKYENYEAIWLGVNIPFKIAKDVIVNSIKFYPSLKYIHISGDRPDKGIPDFVHDMIYIGGATSTAKEYKLKPLSFDDIYIINDLSTINELHEFIRRYYKDKSIIS